MQIHLNTVPPCCAANPAGPDRHPRDWRNHTTDFWAEWCGPCRAIAPVLEELAEASEGRVTLMKINVDDSPALAARYDIRSIPTILFFREGVVVDRVVGAVAKAVLEGIVSARA